MIIIDKRGGGKKVVYLVESEMMEMRIADKPKQIHKNWFRLRCFIE